MCMYYLTLIWQWWYAISDLMRIRKIVCVSSGEQLSGWWQYEDWCEFATTRLWWTSDRWGASCKQVQTDISCINNDMPWIIKKCAVYRKYTWLFCCFGNCNLLLMSYCPFTLCFHSLASLLVTPLAPLYMCTVTNCSPAVELISPWFHTLPWSVSAVDSTNV